MKTEARGCLEPVLCNKRSPHSDRPMPLNEEQPSLPQLEKDCTQQGRPSIAKNE